MFVGKRKKNLLLCEILSVSKRAAWRGEGTRRAMSGFGGGFGGFGAAAGGGFGAFGQQQQQPAAGGFGQPAAGGFGSFGQTQTQATTAFGAPAAGFGASAGGAFGQPAATPAFGGGSAFGPQQTSAPAFGAAPQQTGGFGAAGGFGQAPSAFGAASTGAGGFGGFGAQPTAAAGGFGGGGFGAPQAGQGTGIQTWQKTSGPDGQPNSTNNAQGNYIAITAMPAYHNFSFEELRVQDYDAGRKKAPAGGVFGQPTGGGFGAATSGGAFGQGGTVFGQMNGAAAPAAGAFGAPAAGQVRGADAVHSPLSNKRILICHQTTLNRCARARARGRPVPAVANRKRGPGTETRPARARWWRRRWCSRLGVQAVGGNTKGRAVCRAWDAAQGRSAALHLVPHHVHPAGAR